ncbi:hypothetical protein P7H06_15620 [Paenibacillus larvae]|nr:hypothetical protein [Paenibacillus larvae]MDT2260650.1 hypothetical protein [Paenibacillus larvae]
MRELIKKAMRRTDVVKLQASGKNRKDYTGKVAVKLVESIRITAVTGMLFTR